ncbi:MAG: hypothetical protein VX874_11465 [Pseudomonadota bacterium]|nr:hypothetical protein [Pseudomonadota bacterium]
MTGLRALLAGLCLLVTAGGALAQGRTFVAEGTDVAAAVGARALAMGGSGTAIANDPHAIYYNPALIAGLDRPMLSVTRQLNAKVRPFSFLGMTMPVSTFEPLGLNVTLGYAHFPRVHARSTGAFAASDPQSIFLRLLLPGLGGVYDGVIDSKTLVHRFALGVAPTGDTGLSLGVAVDLIDCRTNTCGVQARTGTTRLDQVEADAISLTAGVAYRFSDRFRVGVSVNDIRTTLHAQMVTVINGTTTSRAFTARLPMTLNAEMAWQATGHLLLTAGYRQFSGRYGTRQVNIRGAYAGAEYTFDNGLALRAGGLRVMQASFNNSGNIRLPIPVIPSVGAGWSTGDFTVDAALYAHPIMSYHYGRAAPTVEVSLSYKF